MARHMTVKMLLELGADARIGFRPRRGNSVPTALLPHLADELDQILASGVCLDRLTADTIFKDDPGARPASLCNLDIHKVPEVDRPTVLRLLKRLEKEDSDALSPALALTTAGFLDEQGRLIPEYENGLLDAC